MNQLLCKSKILIGLIMIVVIALITLCHAKNPKPKTEILVSAASSLGEVLTRIGNQFEAKYPKFKVVYNFAATGVLQTQIEQGAPVDIFAGASLKNLNELSAKGLLAEKSIKTLCHNTLVLVVRDGFIKPEKSDFSLMESNDIQRIAIGDPAYVPAGQYAMELFYQLKLINTIRAKLIFASNVREALHWVETGEADAALVYATDSKIAKRVRIAAQTQPQGPVIISYGITLTRQGAAKSGSRQMIDYITSSAGCKIFKQYGFLP